VSGAISRLSSSTEFVRVVPCASPHATVTLTTISLLMDGRRSPTYQYSVDPRRLVGEIDALTKLTLGSSVLRTVIPETGDSPALLYVNV
jgi:hypothetical protein